MTTDPLLAAALRYAEHGVYVFPVRIGVRGDGKKDVYPIGPSWTEASTTDPEVITRWWTNGYTGAAIGIDTGKSGIVGIDQDVSDGKDGPARWEEIGQKSEGRVRTGSGGLHDYFRADPERPVTVANRGEVADGVDVRGQGGFLIAPPSIDPRGGSWEWEGGEPDWDELPMVPRVVPERLYAAQREKRPKATQTDAPQVREVTHVDPLFAAPGKLFDHGPDGGYKSREDAGALLDRELAEFTALTEPGSGRSHILAQRLAVLAGHGVPSFWSYDAALSILLNACEVNGFTAEHGQKYAGDQARRGLEYGMREPWHPRPVIDLTAAPAPATGRLRRAMHTRSQIRELPPPVPLIEDALYAQTMAVISGKFGTYKTFVTVGMACSLATGTPWFGHRVPAAVPVIYAAAEGAYGIGGRIDAWEAQTGVTVPDSLYLISVAARLTRAEDMTELAELIQETGARVIVFDTLHASVPGADENDAGSMGVVTDVIRELMHRYGVTVILPHHTGHSGERSRGSSSIEDDADTAFVIKLGGDGEDRRPENVRTLHHRKAKDARLLDPVPLHLVESGQSAYVLPLNEYQRVALSADACGETVQEEEDIDVTAVAALRGQDPQAWTAEYVPRNATWQKRIAQVLYTVAGEHGLSMTNIKRAVEDIWQKKQRDTDWLKSFIKVADLEVDGERFVIKADGRFALNAMIRERIDKSLMS